MLYIRNQEHLNRVLEFAQKKGPKYVAWLNEALLRLHLWADTVEDGMEWNERFTPPEDTVWPAEGIPKSWVARAGDVVHTEIGYDGAAASFSWAAYKTINGERRMCINGGLIFHGEQEDWREDGMYIDPFSVELTREVDQNPWSIHT
jgi:hypothetical protein